MAAHDGGRPRQVLLYLLSVTAAQNKPNEVRSKERTDTHLTNKHTNKQMDQIRRQSYNIIYPIICLKSVDVRRLQVVILALSPREMSQTDRILPRYILSRVRVSVRPRIFYTRKNRKPQSPAYSDPRCGDKQRNWKPQNRGNSVV